MRRFVYWLISIFYPVIEIKGAENLPKSGGMILVSNHPNGIIDPVPLMIKIGRPVAFLAKSTLWAIPLLNLFLETFNALPIYRHQDDGKRFGPNGDVPERNEETFTKARQLLQNGGILALFPEGVTHSESQLMPLRTGAARIALQNEADMGWAGQIPIVPIGLWYEDKIRFRSSLLLVVGDPFTLETYQEAYRKDERKTVRELTERIDSSLDSVVLQAESGEILKALPIVTNWLFRDETPSLEQQHAKMTELLLAYETLQHKNQKKLNEISDAMRRYAGLLKALGAKDPWQINLPKISSWQLMSRFLLLSLATPFALLGLLLSYLPYRLAGFVAKRAIQNDYTQLSLAKIVGGLLFFLLTGIGVAIWVAHRFDWQYGLGLLAAMPILALITLWWFETTRSFAQRLTKSRWLGRKGGMRKYVLEQQAIVAQMISEALSTLDAA